MDPASNTGDANTKGDAVVGRLEPVEAVWTHSWAKTAERVADSAPIPPKRPSDHIEKAGRFTTSQIEHIALAPMSDEVRNDNITLAYHRLSEQLAEFLGDHKNANWCTFAVWGSASAGMGIRTAQPPARVTRALNLMPLPQSARANVFARLRRLRSSGSKHASTSLARGNAGVFFDMGTAYTIFLELFAGAASNDAPPDGQDDEARMRTFADRLPPFPASLGKVWGSADRNLLVQGFNCYLAAKRANDPKRRAEMILFANLLLGEYEQRRLQSLLTTAIHAPFIERRDEETATSARSHRLDHIWERLASRHVLSVEMGGQSIPVTSDLGPPPNAGFLPEELRQIEAGELRSYLHTIDPAHTRHEPYFDGTGTAVRSWVNVDERLRFVAALFRSRQQHETTWTAPFPDTDQDALLAGDQPHRMTTGRLSLAHSTIEGGPELTDEALNRLRILADPEVDEIVRRYWQSRSSDSTARPFTRVMAELGKTPEDIDPAIGRYREATGTCPSWADPARMERAQSFYRVLRLPINVALLIASLPEDYGGAKGVRVLEMISGLHTDPKRRIGQTAQFVLDVTGSDLNDPRSVGAHSIRGVRLLHASARHMIEAHSADPLLAANGWAWDEGAGRPINQEDLLGTMISFVLPPLDFLERTGWTYDRRIAEDYLHLWCVVASMLGVPDELLTKTNPEIETLTIEDARLLWARIRSRNHQPSRAGQAMTAALVDALRAETPRPLQSFVPALIRLGIGDELASALAVPPRGLADYVLDRGTRVGTGLRGDEWYRWVMPRIGTRLGDLWYRVFAEGDYAANPPFRFGKFSMAATNN